MVFHKCPMLNLFYKDIKNNELSSLFKYIYPTINNTQSFNCSDTCKKFIISEYLYNKSITTNDNYLDLNLLSEFLSSNNDQIRYNTFLFFIKHHKNYKIINFFKDDSDERIRRLVVKNLDLYDLDILSLLNDTPEIKKIILLKIKNYLSHHNENYLSHNENYSSHNENYSSHHEVINNKVHHNENYSSHNENYSSLNENYLAYHNQNYSSHHYQNYSSHHNENYNKVHHKRIKKINLISDKIYDKIFSLIHDSDPYIRLIVSEIISLPLNFDVEKLLIRNDISSGAVSYGLEDENYLVRRNMLRFIFREVDKKNEIAIKMLFESLLDENIENRILIAEKIRHLEIQHDSFILEKYIFDKNLTPVCEFLVRQKKTKASLLSKIQNLPISEDEKYFLVRSFVKNNFEKFDSIFDPEKIKIIRTNSELLQLINENSENFGFKRLSYIHFFFIIIIYEIIKKYKISGTINKIIEENKNSISKNSIFINNEDSNELILKEIENSNDLNQLMNILNEKFYLSPLNEVRLHENQVFENSLLKRFILFLINNKSDLFFEKLNYKYKYSLLDFPENSKQLSLLDYLKSIDFNKISEIEIIYKIIARVKDEFIILKISNFKFRLTKIENENNFLNNFSDIDFLKSFQENIFDRYGFYSSDFKETSNLKFNEMYMLKIQYAGKNYYLDLNPQMILKFKKIDQNKIYTSLVLKSYHEISITKDKLVKILN
ncbi:hypothetical protein DMUE_4567 [Dictyocoela muelleri]|nr:hypothetical protein DMUE_4567 [Dictyocoela muelleri]